MARVNVDGIFPWPEPSMLAVGPSGHDEWCVVATQHKTSRKDQLLLRCFKTLVDGMGQD